MKKLLLLTSFLFTLTFYAQNNPDFYVAPNGVTCLCPEADFGDTGTLTINGEAKTFTKRSREELDILIDNDVQDPQIPNTCTSGITNMLELFFNKNNFNQNISFWDVSNVTNMENMFTGVTSFNQPLNSWDVSQVINMRQMFALATSFNQPLDNWDVSNVNSTRNMFQSTSSFNQSLDSWDVSQVTDMEAMFYQATSFNKPLDNWNVSNVNNMRNMFYEATSFNKPLGSWDVSNVNSMENMFEKATSFNQPLDNWEVSQVTVMKGMFFSATSFNQPLNNWEVNEVFRMNFMFYGATSFNQPLNNWDVSNVIDMGNMFYETTSFNQPLDNWNVSNVTTMRGMFDSASSFNQPLNSWDVSNVTNMGSMFNGSTSFNQPLNNWNVSNVTDMGRIFNGSTSFNQSLNNWEVSNVTNMGSMFNGSISFDRDLSDWSFNQAVSLARFLSDSGMSSDNYDTLLQSFDNQNLVGLYLSADNIVYCDEQTHSNLIDNKGWTIIGDILGQCGDVFNPSTTPFVTTWTVQDDLSVAIYTFNAFNYDFAVDWGDGEIDQNVTADITHNYASPGTYTVSIIGVFPYFKTCEIATNSSVCDNAPKLSSIESWGDQEWRTMNGSFRSANFNINTAQTPDLSNVTSMYRTFYRATDFNQNINNWDVSQITDMSGTFLDASNFNQPLNSWDVSQVINMRQTFNDASSFNQPLDNWDVSQVTNMIGMFGDTNSFNQPLDNWDVSKVTNMYAMFREATSFNQPLDNWDVSQVTNMYRMFYYATSFNQPLNNWDVSQVTSMRSMFSVTFLFNQPLDNWNVSNVTNMGSMFRSSISFNQPLDNWDVSQVTSMDFMFESASSFNQDLSGWCVEQIPVEPQNFAANSTLQNNFFPNWGADCKNTNPDFNIAPNGVTCLCPEADFGDTGTLTINGETKIFTKRSRAQLDVLIGNNDQDPQIAQTCSTGIADMSSLFLNKSSFNQNISSWDVSNVTSMQSMFEVASSFNQPLDDWDVSQVIDMSFMFGGALVFNQDLSGWCVEQIPDEPFEFAVNSALQIDFFPNWGAECENTNPDFYLAPNGVSCLCPEADFGDTGTFTINGEAKTLTKRTEAELRDLAIIDIDDPQIALTCTSGITNMNDLFNLFNGIIFSFNQNLEHWDVSQVTDMTNMFVYASSFNQALNSWDVSQVTSMQQMFAAASAFDQPLDNWDVSNVTNMRSIFSGASSFNQPLDNWDVSNVTNMRSIFSGASSFNQLLGSWDVSQVTTMTFMFSDASSFNQPLDNWDLSKVTDMQGMFRNATTFDRDLSDWSFNQEVYLDQFLSDSGMSSDNYDTLLQSFDNQNLINLTMGADNIAYCDEQTRSNLIDNKGWTIIGDILGQCGDVLNPSTTPFVTTWTVEDDLSVAIYTLNAFNYDFAVDWGDGEIDQNVTADITHNYASPGTYTVSIIGVFPYFKTCENATDSSVCDNAPKLSSIESWGDQEWRTMNGSFRSANFNINTAQTPDLSNVNSMYRTFYRATDFNQNINNWEVSQINVMTETFRDASNFNQPLNSWDVSQVSDMGGMFYRANSFNQPLESWDVSSVINMSKMFFLASSFNQDLSGWCVEQIPSEPEDFAVNSALQDDFFPNWGAECNLSTTNTDAIGFNILIYPNPSNSKVFIENDGQIILSKIKLMDMLGRDIKIFSASQITNGLDVSGVDAGNYFVQFTTVDDRQFVKRLIVK